MIAILALNIKAVLIAAAVVAGTALLIGAMLGIAGKFPPQVGIYTDKKLHRLRMPAPPDVIGKGFKKLKFRRDAGSDIEKLQVHRSP